MKNKLERLFILIPLLAITSCGNNETPNEETGLNNADADTGTKTQPLNSADVLRYGSDLVTVFAFSKLESV